MAPAKDTRKKPIKATRAATTFSGAWRTKAEDIISVCAPYEWAIVRKGGAIRLDTDPDTEEFELDPDYPGAQLICPMVFAANEYRERIGKEGLPPYAWEQAGSELGLNEFETRVFFYTQEQARVAVERKEQLGALGTRSNKMYWNRWLRARLEAALLR